MNNTREVTVYQSSIPFTAWIEIRADWNRPRQYKNVTEASMRRMSKLLEVKTTTSIAPDFGWISWTVDHP